MNHNRKRELFVCSVGELKMLEAHFERMASRGWLIDKANLFSYEYKKIEPQSLQFSIDILPQITAFDYPHNQDAQEYRRMCEESGWIFATSSKQMQVFYTENKNCIPLPIHTDRKIEAQIMLKTCRKYELLPSLFAILILLCTDAWIINKGYNIFLLNSSITLAIGLAIFTPFALWYLSFALIWYFRTALSIKKDLPTPRVNCRLARWRSLSFGIAAVVFISLILIGTILDILGGTSAFIFISAIIPLVGLVVGLFIRNQIDTKSREKKSNIQMFVVGIIAIAVLSFVVGSFSIHLLNSRMSNSQRLPENRLALMLVDFGIDQPLEFYNYFSADTIAFPLNYTYYEGIHHNTLRTDVKKSISKYLAQKVFQELHKELTDYEWNSVTEMTAGQLDAWGATEGYYLDSLKTEALLLYEKTIVRASYTNEAVLVNQVQEKVKLIGCQ